MFTFPNQKIIHINKKVGKIFLQVNKNQWMNASNELTYNAFKVYLYLAGNIDGHDLALSKKDIFKYIKMSENTYTNVIKELTNKKYIVHKQGNIYDFYTVPQSEGISQCDGISQFDVNDSTNTVEEYTQVEYVDASQSDGVEIYNINKINIKYIDEAEQSSSSEGADAPSNENKERTLEDLSDDELKSLMYGLKVSDDYSEWYKEYNLINGQIDNTTKDKINDILTKRKINKIKQELTEEAKQELMRLINVKEDELQKFLAAITIKASPDELVEYLRDNPRCTYENCIDYYNRDKSEYLRWLVISIDMGFYSYQREKLLC